MTLKIEPPHIVKSWEDKKDGRNPKQLAEFYVQKQLSCEEQARRTQASLLSPTLQDYDGKEPTSEV